MKNSNVNLKKVTNLDYLIDLSKGNMQFVKEMINTFLVENPKEIESLEKAIQSKNFEDIKQTAHLLQSSIPFVGLDKIIENEVYEIEKIAADKSVLKKIEILPADKSDIQKIEILSTDKPSLQKIELLFSKVKEACENARQELKDTDSYQLSQEIKTMD